MKNSKLPILLAIISIFAASLACGAPAIPSAPAVSNIYMATDPEGKSPTSTFTPDQDFFVFFEVNNVPAGTPFQSQWFVLNVEGEDPNTAFHTIDYALEENVELVYFQLTNPDPWPAGDYRVDIYMNGNQVGNATFSVQ
jgi:hypothetical protein